MAALAVLALGGGTAGAVIATRSSRGGSSEGTWFKPGTPQLEVSVARGCPGSVITGYADVVNTFPGPALVPADPTDGLICRYGPGVGLGPNGSGGALLVSSTRLDEGQAQELANVISKIDLAAPTGVFFCPGGFRLRRRDRIRISGEGRCGAVVQDEQVSGLGQRADRCL